MNLKTLFPSLIILQLSLPAFSQDHNPFKSIGKKGKILTLSNGKYDEIIEKDSLERIGTVIINRYARKIETFLNEDSFYTRSSGNIQQSRFLSVDPLASKFAMLSPYQYASNRPIDGTDIDGLEYLPYQKSMYRLKYLTDVTQVTLGNGSKLDISTSSTVVSEVYENIPAALQNGETKSFKYVSGGPVTAYGRDWDVSKDGSVIYSAGRYYNNGPAFNGTADQADAPEPSSSTKGVPYGYEGPTPSTPGEALKEGAGIVQNYTNQSIWKGLTKESVYRNGFYNATNLADYYLNNNKIGGSQLSGASDRTNLINFLTDGYLPTGETDKFTGSEYTNLRREAYGKQLLISYHGLQILKDNGIQIRQETKLAVQDLLKKYKENGGSNNYDNISQLIGNGNK